MKNHHNIIVAVATTISIFVVSANSFAGISSVAVTNYQETVEVETIDTTNAHPTKIKVTKLKNALNISGVIKRKRHNYQTIRGHVDVDLISASGEIIDSKFMPLKNFIGSAKHDHERKFTAKFALPSSSDYQVKVRHHIYMDGHE